MDWQITHRADKWARAIADRHYSRVTPGAVQFAPPGFALVLLTANHQALWVSSWQKETYAPYPGWICSLFRRESGPGPLASELIRQAVAVTRWAWGNPPMQGMLTFIDPRKVRSVNPGWCFKMAGFQLAGRTQSGHVILRLAPEAMPAPAIPNNAQLRLFDESEVLDETPLSPA